VEPSFCILPDKRQIPVSLLKLAGYTLVKDSCFVFQTFRLASRTTAPAFTGTAKLNLGKNTIEKRVVWFDVLMEGFL